MKKNVYSKLILSTNGKVLENKTDINEDLLALFCTNKNCSKIKRF